MTPFLKWPGGKRWLVQQHPELFPSRYRRFIEPFLGSGSVYFYLEPREALLGDMNADLIDTYNAVKTCWSALLDLLENHQTRHSPTYYYRIRSKTLTDPVERAARFIYLNRTCFNGIFRVNKQGQFNVPIGTKTAVVLPTDDFEAVSRLLQGAECRSADFEALIDEAAKGDLLFVDPPYTVRHNVNGFRKYNEQLFSWGDQERLAGALRRANSRGARIIMTNAYHQSICTLYRGGFKQIRVRRFSSISAKCSGRSAFDELVVMN